MSLSMEVRPNWGFRVRLAQNSAFLTGTSRRKTFVDVAYLQCFLWLVQAEAFPARSPSIGRDRYVFPVRHQVPDDCSRFTRMPMHDSGKSATRGFFVRRVSGRNIVRRPCPRRSKRFDSRLVLGFSRLSAASPKQTVTCAPTCTGGSTIPREPWTKPVPPMGHHPDVDHPKCCR